jgi:hypothetical protein
MFWYTILWQAALRKDFQCKLTALTNRCSCYNRYPRNVHFVGHTATLCIGMSSANPEQADIIQGILGKSSILVVCPEILESLFYLRSSLCAAVLAKVDPYNCCVQVILLTPTDNLAKILYRPLKGYARFCQMTTARLCLDDTTAADASDECAASPLVDPALSAYRLSTHTYCEHILVGTPKSVLAHLKAAEQTHSRISVMGICHAHDVFETTQHSETLAELTRGLHVVQVLSITTCIRPSCE